MGNVKTVDDPALPRVGIVGLGNMGLPMAHTLTRAGLRVSGTDLSAERRKAFEGAAPDLAALVAACDVVVLSLPNSAIVESVLGDGSELRAGKLVIDTSTADPASTRRLQPMLARLGIGFVDAPVSGGAAGAADGQLLVMAGGEAADLARAMPVLKPLARKIVACGGPGAGNVVKLVNNHLAAAHLALAGEALGLAVAAGVSPEVLLEALNSGSGRSAATEVNLPRWVMSGKFDSGFTMALMRKDVRLAGALAEALGFEGALSRATRDVWARSVDRLADGEDFNRIVELARGGGT